VRVLVVNAGSSSLKLAVLEDDGAVAAERTVERWQGEGDADPVKAFLEAAGTVDAVGHRVVHGGPRHADPVVVEPLVVSYLWSISHLAPLHNPRALHGITAVEELLPGVPQVACFDTTFHATIPPEAHTYALPREWNDRWQLRRYGFHGLSHAYAVRRGAELAGRRPEDLRVVSCHLGAGASLAAVRGGASIDTTMGFTPLAGLVMNTRTGSVDPGLVLWLLEHRGLTSAELTDALEHRSGLTGLAGTGDMRELLPRADAGEPDAQLALDVYVHRLRAGVAAMAAAMGGLDALAFTGGVGEHAPAIRARAVAGLGFLGVSVDPERNAAATGDALIGDGTLVVTAREDLEMARQVRALSGPATDTGAAAAARRP
jgi:acetate kinase